MTPVFVTRADHELIGRVLAAKLALRTDRNSGEQWVKVVGKEVGRPPLDTPPTIAQKEGERASWQSLNLTL